MQKSNKLTTERRQNYIALSTGIVNLCISDAQQYTFTETR